MKKAVCDLMPGDVIDLEGDAYADPKRDNVRFETENVTVAGVIPETDECWCLMVEGVDWFGMPPDHMVEWIGNAGECEPC